MFSSGAGSEAAVEGGEGAGSSEALPTKSGGRRRHKGRGPKHHGHHKHRHGSTADSAAGRPPREALPADANERLQFLLRGGKPYLGFGCNDTTSTVSLQPGQWAHVAWRYNIDAQQQCIFINGVRVASQSFHQPLAGNHDLFVGHNGTLCVVVVLAAVRWPKSSVANSALLPSCVCLFYNSWRLCAAWPGSRVACVALLASRC